MVYDNQIIKWVSVNFDYYNNFFKIVFLLFKNVLVLHYQNNILLFDLNYFDINFDLYFDILIFILKIDRA